MCFFLRFWCCFGIACAPISRVLFLDEKVPKTFPDTPGCIVSPACSIRGQGASRGRTGKARMPRISKLALVVIALRRLGWVACCFCGLSAWFSAQTLICFTGILAFPVLNATRPVGKPGAARAGLERCRWVGHFCFGNVETPPPNPRQDDNGFSLGYYFVRGRASGAGRWGQLKGGAFLAGQKVP